MDIAKLQHLRRIAMIEGISCILLFGVAMPMKYLYAMPMAVSIVGGIHGILFIWVCWLILQVHLDRKWTLSKSFLVFLATIPPGGPFISDIWLKREAEAQLQDGAVTLND